MKICHFSDWHGKLPTLPEADVYVCTGDMLPNTRMWRWVDKRPEQEKQLAWARENPVKVPFGATVICVRGNHDFIDAGEQFKDANAILEFMDTPSTCVVNGVRFGGFRGVRRIDGEQSDELGERELEARCDELARLGPIDVLVTHGPAFDRLDNDYGSRSLRDFMDGRFAKAPRAHLFGHIHESKGVETIGGVVYSNAATTVNVVELKP